MSSELKSTETAFPQARVGPDGELTFPHRGTPPKTIQGYKADPGDPYVFKPLIKPCIYRGVSWRKVCGGMVQSMHCSKFQIGVKIIDCLECQDRKES